MTGALEGLLVADFTRVLAGPLATMTLGDLGAEVIKVERPELGDETRWWGPPWLGSDSTYYLGLNRNKRSVTLDLSDPDDRDLAERLALRADVVVENFRPGTMERFGLGWDTLHRKKPELIYCSITAFGDSADSAHLVGYDLVLEAMSGLMSLTGEEGGPPFKVGVALLDMISGLYAVVGIEAALAGRALHGRPGQRVSVSLLDCGLAALLNQASGYLNTGAVPSRHGNRHPSIAPYETFEAADRPFVVAVGNDATWVRLCVALGAAELANRSEFATNRARVEHRDALDGALSAVFASAPAATWVARLQDAGVPCALINDVAEAFALANELGLQPTADFARNDGSLLRTVRSPLLLTDTPVTPRRRPPNLGEHGGEIRAWLQGEP